MQAASRTPIYIYIYIYARVTINNFPSLQVIGASVDKTRLVLHARPDITVRRRHEARCSRLSGGTPARSQLALRRASIVQWRARSNRGRNCVIDLATARETIDHVMTKRRGYRQIIVARKWLSVEPITSTTDNFKARCIAIRSGQTAGPRHGPLAVGRGRASGSSDDLAVDIGISDAVGLYADYKWLNLWSKALYTVSEHVLLLVKRLSISHSSLVY